MLLRAWIGCLVAVALALLVQSTVAAEGRALDPAAANTADLQTRLEKDLRARRPVEFAFIARVIQLVNEGKLPLSLVDRTYLWARTKPHNPFQYFERALRTQAGRLGVTI